MSPPRAVVLDMEGVLHVDWHAIAGSAAAVERLTGAGVGLAVLTNTTGRTRADIAGRLEAMGMPIPAGRIVTAASAAAASASISAAVACAMSACTVSAENTASTSPAFTASPTLTRTSVSRRPPASLPTMASCQGATLPLATRRRGISAVSGCVVVTVSAALAVAVCGGGGARPASR